MTLEELIKERDKTYESLVQVFSKGQFSKEAKELIRKYQTLCGEIENYLGNKEEK